MNIHSAQLGEVAIERQQDSVLPVILDDFTSVEEYSRFKYGDGEAANKYGTMLGHAALSIVDCLPYSSETYVTTSAYRIAPPASESMLKPFIKTFIQNSGLTGDSVVPFKISKTRLAADNYAFMSLEERSKTLQDDLTLPPKIDFNGKRVIVLDDIRVTGLRELALTALLAQSGAAEVSFLYVLNTVDGKSHPETEAALNTASVRALDDIIELANRPRFVPNVRLCKFIAAQTLDELERFCQAVPEEVARTVAHYIKIENLREVIKHTP